MASIKFKLRRTTLIALSIIFLLGFLSIYIKNQRSLKTKAQILAECVTHEKEKSKHHYHLQLQIVQNDQLLPIPADTGINRDTNCMHPLHTHDATGKIHVEYPTTINFTLGDFFDTAGVTFHDNQLGAMTTYEGYKITAFVNGEKKTSNFRMISLQNDDSIKLEITADR